MMRRSEQLFAQVLGKRSKPSNDNVGKNAHLYIITAGAVITSAILGYGLSRPNYSIQGSTNASIVGSAAHVTINNNKPLRDWSDLPYNEREAIVTEAKQKFPEIQNIGTGVSWKPIAKWLAEEKGVIHNNPRDLFR